jgi:hypothetical protein
MPPRSLCSSFIPEYNEELLDPGPLDTHSPNSACQVCPPGKICIVQATSVEWGQPPHQLHEPTVDPAPGEAPVLPVKPCMKCAKKTVFPKAAQDLDHVTHGAVAKGKAKLHAASAPPSPSVKVFQLLLELAGSEHYEFGGGYCRLRRNYVGSFREVNR